MPRLSRAAANSLKRRQRQARAGLHPETPPPPEPRPGSGRIGVEAIDGHLVLAIELEGQSVILDLRPGPAQDFADNVSAAMQAIFCTPLPELSADAAVWLAEAEANCRRLPAAE